MNTRHRLLLATVSLLVVSAALAQEHNPARRQPAGLADQPDERRLIVKFRAPSTDRVQALAAGDRVAALAVRSGVAMRRARALATRLDVVALDSAGGESLDAQLERVRADASVEYAEPDRRRYPHAVPNDPLYTGQWFLQRRADAPSAIDAEHAWDLTTGSADVVIAVLDTGVLANHPDLGPVSSGGRILPGYDFISDPTIANDGDGRDADATDPGDFVTHADVSTTPFSGCDESPSSWHGTRVAGIIGARTNNGEGVAGGTWSPWILPVRVLGKCGGLDSDILAALLWSAGLHVDGVPNNPYPAHVVNLSLGAVGGCSNAYRDVINTVLARGTAVVASAGNEGGPVDAPANCPGVVAVGGLRHVGTKVGYSNLGPEVAVSAPAGNCVNVGVGQPCLFSIDTTVNSGTMGPSVHTYTNQISANYGTSFSAPIVAAIAGLMVSVNGNLDPAEIAERLREGAAKPFPVSADSAVPVCHVPTSPTDIQGAECGCTTSTCGAGMANALGSINAALRPIAVVTGPGSVSAGRDVTLSGAGSAAANGRTVTGHAWSVLCGAAGLSSLNGPQTTIVAPAVGSVTVRLTVSDDAGRQDTADIEVTGTAATPVGNGESCPISVTVTPATALVQAGSTRTFAAALTNTQDTAVAWQVNGVAGGNATVGTISSAGVYAAPASVPSPAEVTITAVSSADATRSGSAQVTVTAASAPSSGGDGGGGAALDLALALLVLGGLARRRRHSS